MIEGSIIGEFQVFQVILKPDPSTVIIPFRAFHHSDFIRIEKIESITERFVSTFCHYGMFMADPQFPYRNGQPIHIISFLHQFQNPVICIQLIIRPSGFGRFFIQSGTHFVFQFFFCIHQIIIRKIGYFEVGTTVIRQLQFPGFGKYRLDHHNAVSST
ncbi:unknown [Odoribacter splanchnicus CAG:14]|nr:unknown [Odoribacter splanchnicus CAG:14]